MVELVYTAVYQTAAMQRIVGSSPTVRTLAIAFYQLKRYFAPSFRSRRGTSQQGLLLIAVPDAALRRLAQARTLRPAPPPEVPTALEPTTPRAMPRPRRRTG